MGYVKARSQHVNPLIGLIRIEKMVFIRNLIHRTVKSQEEQHYKHVDVLKFFAQTPVNGFARIKAPKGIDTLLTKWKKQRDWVTKVNSDSNWSIFHFEDISMKIMYEIMRENSIEDIVKKLEVFRVTKSGWTKDSLLWDGKMSVDPFDFVKQINDGNDDNDKELTLFNFKRITIEWCLRQMTCLNIIKAERYNLSPMMLFEESLKDSVPSTEEPSRFFSFKTTYNPWVIAVALINLLHSYRVDGILDSILDCSIPEVPPDNTKNEELVSSLKDFLNREEITSALVDMEISDWNRIYMRLLPHELEVLKDFVTSKSSMVVNSRVIDDILKRWKGNVFPQLARYHQIEQFEVLLAALRVKPDLSPKVLRKFEPFEDIEFPSSWYTMSRNTWVEMIIIENFLSSICRCELENDDELKIIISQTTNEMLRSLITYFNGIDSENFDDAYDIIPKLAETELKNRGELRTHSRNVEFALLKFFKSDSYSVDNLSVNSKSLKTITQEIKDIIQKKRNPTTEFLATKSIRDVVPVEKLTFDELECLTIEVKKAFEGGRKQHLEHLSNILNKSLIKVQQTRRGFFIWTSIYRTGCIGPNRISIEHLTRVAQTAANRYNNCFVMKNYDGPQTPDYLLKLNPNAMIFPHIVESELLRHLKTESERKDYISKMGSALINCVLSSNLIVECNLLELMESRLTLLLLPRPSILRRNDEKNKENDDDNNNKSKLPKVFRMTRHALNIDSSDSDDDTDNDEENYFGFLNDDIMGMPSLTPTDEESIVSKPTKAKKDKETKMKTLKGNPKKKKKHNLKTKFDTRSQMLIDEENELNRVD
eukprot:TRINITY_DN1124_c3_g1_i1.p1 TRINITY_DN1124_c3_g1~~TRINITY_DN1124_c3_g1_i1.p1  ORF type:complete len:942 (-),score=243.99 TRINITY_DN1124_c3_g1_i1:21-2483(-)